MGDSKMINMKDLIKKQTDMIRKESGMKIDETHGGDYLIRMSGEIFDAVNQLSNVIKKHPKGKNNPKIKKMIKQLNKIESDLSTELEDL